MKKEFLTLTICGLVLMIAVGPVWAEPKAEITGLAVAKPNPADKFADAIAKLPKGCMVILAVSDEATHSFNKRAQQAILSIGGKVGLLRQPRRSSYYCIGRKGFKPGQAIEKIGRKKIFFPPKPFPRLTKDWGQRHPARNALNRLEEKPQSRGDKVRSLIAAYKWSEVEKTALTATPVDGDSNEVQGPIAFDEPILLRLKKFTRKVRYGRNSIPWIEFSKDKGKLYAKIELGCLSYPRPKFLTTVRLLSHDGKVLATAEASFANSENISVIPWWNTHVVDLSFDDWENLSKATIFHVTVKKLPFSASHAE